MVDLVFFDHLIITRTKYFTVRTGMQRYTASILTPDRDGDGSGYAMYGIPSSPGTSSTVPVDDLA